MSQPLCVLSIQSEVVRGHVGNSAARFALQRLGLDVWAVPTVLLSNHPGHGRFRGETTSAAAMAALIDGLDGHGWLSRCDGVISGYLGAAEQARVVADAVRRVKTQNPRALYLCDPVFGDDDGAYARPGVAEAMARELVPLSDIVTPNRFELSSLTSKKIDSAADAVAAVRVLGKAETVVTSVPFDGERIGTVAVTRDGTWAVSAPRIDQVPNGSGDLLAALYLAARLAQRDVAAALTAACSAVDGVLRASAGADELRLVAAQAEIVQPTRVLAADAVR
ncbi:MAG: pyridoxal kinase PdxY [Alphaproteobacteria bacterium]|nr:pyridoxal kinase PdxY [Alphaproteobacteria bacterium]